MTMMRLLNLVPIFLLAFFIAGTRNGLPAEIHPLPSRQMLDCAPSDPYRSDSLQNGKFITALPGWGSYSHRVSTQSDSAQFYFDQGLNMYFGYQFGEAQASFREAARFDPHCPMTWWGLALSLGPYYNSAHRFLMRPGTPEILKRMNEESDHASPKEKQLMEAMNKRYAADPSDRERRALNEAYARSMMGLANEYPEDPDINVLYIDAFMLIHPWDFWNNDGSPKSWTAELIKTCASILKSHPNHPGALHYYIHLTEASRNPEVALHAADILKDLLPGIPHMVHMSSHEYERNGIYGKGVAVNELADHNLVVYDSLTHLYPRIHISHYFAVQVFCAMSGNMYTRCMPLAFRCRNSVSPDYAGTPLQWIYEIPMISYVRMGKWMEILKDSDSPDKHWPFAQILYDFAKGMASANQGDPEAAHEWLQKLKQEESDRILTIVDTPFNAPIQIARVAENILNASILYIGKDFDAALSTIKMAISLEDELIYREPKSWLIPARQYLGHWLLKLHQPVQAEKIYRQDLSWNPGNGWSILGMYQSLLAQGSKKEAEPYRSRYMQSFSGADEIPPGSVY
jgi:tetratricopeptide (TPR) repeat protein